MSHQLSPAFRHRESGKVVATKSYHDIEHPEVASWENPEEGYVDHEGKFYTREEAKAKFVKSADVIFSDVKDTKDSVKLLAKQVEEMVKAEKAHKSLITPHNHRGSAAAGPGVDDVPPGKINPVGHNDAPKNTKMVKATLPGAKSKKKPESLVGKTAKAETMTNKNCKKCGELWKADAEKCAKCGEMSLPMEKAKIDEGMTDREKASARAQRNERRIVSETPQNPKSVQMAFNLTDGARPGSKNMSVRGKPRPPEGVHLPAKVGGLTVKGSSVAGLAAELARIHPNHKAREHYAQVAQEAHAALGYEKAKSPLDKAEIVYDPTGKLSLKGVNSKAVLPGDKATTSEISAEGSGGQIKKNSVKGLRKAALAFQKAALEMNKAEPPMAKPPSGQSPGKLPVSKPQAPKAPAMGKIALPDAVPGEPAKLKKPLRAGVMSAKDAQESVTKGDFGMTDSGKASTLPAAPAAAPEPKKPQYTMENLKADKAKLLQADVKPKPGIFGRLSKKKD